MTTNEMLILQLGEECAEVAQMVSKTLRFGVDEVRPGQDLNNSQRLTEECTDLIAVIELLQAHGIVGEIWQLGKNEKKEKVRRYLGYSKEVGTLKD
jgi:NTP pyrophosphatase (non-canonical NTP hydrolase)